MYVCVRAQVSVPLNGTLKSNKLINILDNFSILIFTIGSLHNGRGRTGEYKKLLAEADSINIFFKTIKPRVEIYKGLIRSVILHFLILVHFTSTNVFISI